MSAVPSEEPPEDLLDFIGPFEYHAVVLNGRRVPHLTATPLPGGRVSIGLDNRFGIEISLAEAQQVVPFVAHCLAVGMGYTGFPDPDKEPVASVDMPRMRPISLS